MGVYASLGCCSSVVVEMEAIRIGLEIAWNEGFMNVICEADALSVVHILGHPPTPTDPLAWLVSDCRLLIERD